MSYVYRHTESQLWTVGTYDGGAWEPESDHGTADGAAQRVRWLNGGNDGALQSAALDVVQTFNRMVGARAAADDIIEALDGLIDTLGLNVQITQPPSTAGVLR